jgi:hypothetical protein
MAAYIHWGVRRIIAFRYSLTKMATNRRPSRRDASGWKAEPSPTQVTHYRGTVCRRCLR